MLGASNVFGAKILTPASLYFDTPGIDLRGPALLQRWARFGAALGSRRKILAGIDNAFIWDANGEIRELNY